MRKGKEASVTTILSPEVPKDEAIDQAMTRMAKLIKIISEAETAVVVVRLSGFYGSRAGTNGQPDTADTRRKTYVWGVHERPISSIGVELFEEARCNP